MKVTVTQKHLKQAISELRSSQDNYCNKCVLAVAARELFPSEPVSMASDLRVGTDYLRPISRYAPSKTAKKIMHLFDCGLDWNKTYLTELRKMLPTTVVFKEISQ